MNFGKSLQYFGSYVLGDVIQSGLKTYQDPISSTLKKVPFVGGYAADFFNESFLNSEKDALTEALGLAGGKTQSLTFDQFNAATAGSAVGGSNFRSRGLGQAGQISMGKNGQVNTALTNPNVQKFLMSQSRIKIPAATIRATNTIPLPTTVPKVKKQK